MPASTPPADTPTASDLILADVPMPPADTPTVSDSILADAADMVSNGILDYLYLSPDPASPDPVVTSPELFSASPLM